MVKQTLETPVIWDAILLIIDVTVRSYDIFTHIFQGGVSGTWWIVLAYFTKDAMRVWLNRHLFSMAVYLTWFFSLVK